MTRLAQVVSLLGVARASAAPPPEQSEFFEKKIRPVLASECLECHGAEKQKGGYRLDQPELALKGGESGNVAIKPGDPVGSHLVQLIPLPAEHDDIMPPEGKEPLKSEEIMILLEWIRNGAVFPPENTIPVAAGQ